MKPGPADLERDLLRFYSDEAEADCGRDSQLTALLLDELEESERQELERHLADCPNCRAVLELADSAESVWNRGGQAKPRIGLRPGLGRLLKGPFWPRLAAAAAVVLVLVIGLVWVDPGAQPGPSERLIPKGDWQLHVAAEVEGRTFRVTSGDELPAGTRLGFFYTAQRAGHLMVMYVDEAGEIVRLVPAERTHSTSIRPGQQVRLPDGAVLSPGRGCEWVVAFFSTDPLADRQAAQALARMLQDRNGCKLDGSAARLPNATIRIVQVQR